MLALERDSRQGLNGRPVGPLNVLLGFASRPEGPGWENGWPFGPQDQDTTPGF